MKPIRFVLLFTLLTTPAALMAAEIGTWNFDEGEGSVTTSSTAKKHVGSITGATWSEGKSGQALVFKGPDYSEPYRPPGTFVAIDASEGLNPTKKVEVSASIMPTFNPVAWGGIVEKGVGFGSSYRLLMLRSGKIRATIGNDHKSVDSPEAVELNAWVSVKMTYDGATLTLFVNGKKVAEAAVETKALASDQPIEIGRRFTGKIDDVKIAY